MYIAPDFGLWAVPRIPILRVCTASARERPTVQLGPYSVANQAFNNAKSVTLAFILDLELDGLIGMSFYGQGDVSSVGDTLQGNPNFPEGAGLAFILNVVDQTPAQNSFIAFSLSRTDDQEGTADASFTINDVDPKYAAVRSAPILPLFPGNIGEWGFIMEGLTVDGKPVEMPPSNVAGVPPGQMVLRLDTGTPLGSMPQALIDGIYTLIPGAVNQKLSFLGPNTIWTLPCNSTAILSLQIGGQEFPIHPLDISDVLINPSTNRPVCVTPFNTFTPAFGMDIFAGDSFMRNFYSVFNFGVENPQSAAEAPSVQLLSQTDPQSAIQDTLNVRAALLDTIAQNVATQSQTQSSTLTQTQTQGGIATGSGAANAANPVSTGKKNGVIGGVPQPAIAPRIGVLLAGIAYALVVV